MHNLADISLSLCESQGELSMSGGSTDELLHAVFLPAMAPGHMMPLVNIARLFAAHHHHNIRVTIITTPMNALRFQTAIDQDVKAGLDITLQILPFPSAEAGLPQGMENVSDAPTPEMTMKLFYAIGLLRPKIETLIRDQLRPGCIVSDVVFPWTADLAEELGIPRVGFVPTFFFTLSVGYCIEHYQPHKSIECDTEPFVVPTLPDQVVLTKSQLGNSVTATRKDVSGFVETLKEAEKKSLGMLVNSYYELESGYVDYYRNTVGMKAWHVGPVSIFFKDDQIAKAERSKHSCLSWLDSKKPKSVLYVCFGSLTRFTKAQLTEIAYALENTGHFFVWVVGKVLRKEGDGEGDEEWWLPEGFEVTANESRKGLIIRGWAPQVLVLEHEAIGGFMTHAGTNSILEAVTAGVPVVTWPLFADQFQNEKLVTQVLKCGLPVGNLIWKAHSTSETALIMRENIEKAVSKVMGDDRDAEQMRKTAGQLSELAKKAVEDGGSSAKSLKALIEEIRTYVKK